MFAKFATAKNREKIDPQTFSFSGAICPITARENGVMVKRVHFVWVSNLQLPDYKACYNSGALSLSYIAS